MATSRQEAWQGGNRSADLRAILEHGQRYSNLYTGDWTAPWLLSTFAGNQWQIRSKNTRRVGETWKGNFVLDWEVPLADGLYLTDSPHHTMCTLAKKIIFLMRSLPPSDVSSSITHRHLFLNAKAILQWMYLHGERFQPDLCMFQRIDQQAVEDYLRELKQGGVAWLLRVPHRTLIWLYKEALGRRPLADMEGKHFLVPRPDGEAIIQWLQANHYYVQEKQDWTGEPIRSVDRRKLAQILHVDVETLRSSPKFAAFIRQFEPDLLILNPHLLLPARGVRGAEAPLHTTPTLDEVRRAPYGVIAMRHHVNVWSRLQDLTRQFSGSLKLANALDIPALYRIANTGDKGQHTPWVPMTTALAYTREALRWAAQYTDVVVAFYLEAIGVFKSKGWFSYQADSVDHDIALSAMRDRWVVEHCPAQLRPLGICGWTCWFSKNQREPFRKLRERPGLNDVMQVMIGAAIVLVGMTKPIRESEILALRKDAARFVPGDGYWLEQMLAKKVVADRHAQTAKPIPAITARVLSALVRLSDGVDALLCSPDPYARERIFYLPSFVRDASLKAKLYEPTDLSRLLNRFCDYVALSTDEYGRRWYVRVHELRKSFLITFFWCFRYASLDAARWIAGHTNGADLYAYIEANFPGDELPHLEAEYAAMQLWRFQTEGYGEATNAAELYQAVCSHFAVREISLIPARELNDWLELAFLQGIYRIEPYSITGAEEMAVQIAFRIGRRKEEQS